MWRRSLRTAWAAVAIFGSLACGASASFQNGVYDDGIVRYRVGRLTPGFLPVSVSDNDLAWHHPGLGTVSVNSTCTEYEDVPSVALLNQLLFGTTQRVYRVDETMTLDGRAAYHVIVDMELDGVPLSLDVYLLKKDGCVYDLTYMASRASAEKGRALFEGFVRSFAVLSTRLPAP
jgi:hypothetical protein